MRHTVSVVTMMVLACALAFGAGTLDNSTVKSTSVSGDGSVGDFQFPIGVPHLSGCSVAIRYEGDMYESTVVSSTERTYNNNLHVGYGRYAHGSNFFACSASYLDPGNSYLDQTIVLLTRTPSPLSTATIMHYIDPDVQGTKTNDYGNYNSVKKMVSQSEGNACVGLVSFLDGMPSATWAVDYVNSVRSQMQNTILSQPPVQNVTDMAAVVSWTPAPWPSAAQYAPPKVLLSRLIAAADESAAANKTGVETLDQYRRVHVPDAATRIIMKKMKFTQKLNTFAKDSFTLKGTVDLSQYPTEMTNLFYTDVSLFIANFVAVMPTNTPYKSKPYMLKYKLEDDGWHGKRTLTLSLDKKKRILTYQLSISKASIQDITYLGTASAGNGVIYIPFTLVLTGSSPTSDPAKGGKCWIIASSFPVNFTKTTNNIKGKL